jgi:hypothetical protein
MPRDSPILHASSWIITLTGKTFQFTVSKGNKRISEVRAKVHTFEFNNKEVTQKM